MVLWLKEGLGFSGLQLEGFKVKYVQQGKIFKVKIQYDNKSSINLLNRTSCTTCTYLTNFIISLFSTKNAHKGKSTN